MFAYCENNPVIRTDKGGEIWNFVIGAGVGALISGAIEIYSQCKSGDAINWAAVGVAAAGGAITGVVAASGAGLLAQVAVSSFTGTIVGVTNAAIKYDKNNDNLSIGARMVVDGTVGGIVGAVGGFLGGRGGGHPHIDNTLCRYASKVISPSKTAPSLKYVYSQISTIGKQCIPDTISGISKSSISGIAYAVATTQTPSSGRTFISAYYADVAASYRYRY